MKKSKMAATSSKLCLLCDFLKDTNITEQDNHIKQHGMFIDVIAVHFKLILMNMLAYPRVLCHRNTHFYLFRKRMYMYRSFETFEKDNVKYYLQFGVGSRHGNWFRED